MEPENPPQPTVNEREPSSWSRKLKRLAFVVIGAIVGLGAAYGFGWWQASRLIDQERGEKERAVQAKAMLEQKLSSERDALQRLESRRQLHLSLLALDQRNFGIAQEHIEKAVRLLAGRSSGDLEALRASLAELRLLATEDLADQRVRLIEVIRRFDRAVPPPPPEPGP